MSARRGGPMRWAVLATALLVPAACDSGPEGPGPLTARVESAQPLGAVVLEVSGAGVTGFEGQGATRVFGAVDALGPGRHRVVLVSPDGATELRFSVVFADRKGAMPAVTALSAASPANVTMSAAGVKVRIER